MKKTSLQGLKNLIKEAVRQLLKEAKCPYCGDKDAYHGITTVKCPNHKCMAYDENYAKSVGRIIVDKAYIQKLVRYVEVFGLTDSGPSRMGIMPHGVTYNSLEELAKKLGLEQKDDESYQLYYSPKAWRKILGSDFGTRDPSRKANLDPNIIYAGNYDPIYWKAISADAQNVARTLNDKYKNPGIGDRASSYGIEDEPDIGHFSDVFNYLLPSEIIPSMPDGLTEVQVRELMDYYDVDPDA